jgi:putative ABC transport system permease protein
VSPANWDAFRKEATAFSAVEATYSFLVNVQLELPAGREVVTGTAVTPGMFDLLGTPALHGRGLVESDDANTAVLSHGLWTRLFNADPDVVGKTLTVTGAQGPVLIVGVMPEHFVFPYKSMLGPSGFVRALSADLWQPLLPSAARMIDPSGQPVRTVHFLAVIGRLKSGASPAEADAQLQAIAARRANTFTDTNAGWSVTSMPLLEQVVGRVRPAVLLLAGGVGLLLLMTCLNIANVLLARATGSQADLAVRAALGASGGRLLQQSMIESLTLALFGGVAGTVVVFFGTRLILCLAPSDLPRLTETRFSAPVVLFALGISTLAGVVIGLIPAVASFRTRMSGLRETHRTTASAARQRTRAALVVSELALATVLTVGAALLVRSFVEVMRVDPGFDATHVLSFQQNVPQRIQTPVARIAFLDDFSSKLRALPGVTHVGGTTRIPLGSTQVTTQLTVEGRDVPAASLPEVEMRRAVGDYFGAMGIPVLKGRVFEPTDRAATVGLAVVNAALAATVFPGEQAVGRRVRMGPSPTGAWLEIIGVVGDIRHSSLEERPRPEIYISYLQGPPVSPFMTVRASDDPAALIQAVRQVATDAGADPPYNVSTMKTLRSESMALRRFTVLLAGLFGVLALALAAVGVYGVLALVVAERTGEVGVRMALGAAPWQILSMLVGYAGRLGAIGVAIGLLGGLALAQIARTLLFGVPPTDIITFVAVPLLLLAVAIAAALIPATRATKISPASAMRE